MRNELLMSNEFLECSKNNNLTVLTEKEFLSTPIRIGNSRLSSFILNAKPTD